LYLHFIQPDLQKTLEKLSKKDKKTYDITLAKIQEIISSSDIHHYKNLHKPKQHLKRVHIHKSFVLTFSFDASQNCIIFVDIEHHDDAY